MKPNERIQAVCQGRTGDQAPIEAPFERITRLPELVERYGRY